MPKAESASNEAIMLINDNPVKSPELVDEATAEVRYVMRSMRQLGGKAGRKE